MAVILDFPSTTWSFDIKTDLLIRPLVEGDLSKLEWFGAYRQYRNVYREAWREQMKGNRLLLVADFNGFPVGQIYLQFKRGNPLFSNGYDKGYLYSFRVMEPFRRLGIGTHLVDAAEHEFRIRGFQIVTIAVAKNNPDALKLYQRLGYSIFDEDPGKWSYVDPDGNTHQIEEPCWALKKRLQDGPQSNLCTPH